MSNVDLMRPGLAVLDAYSVLEFDEFQVLPRRRQLIRGGSVVRIGDRAFDLLALLTRRAGEIVPHGELIDAAWRNLVVSDSNLKVQIASLQRLLGNAPDGERYIKNVALRGYLFVGEVRAHAHWASNVSHGFQPARLVANVRT